MSSKLLALLLCLLPGMPLTHSSRQAGVSLPEREIPPFCAQRVIGPSPVAANLPGFCAGDELTPLIIESFGVDNFFAVREYEGKPELRLVRLLHRNFRGRSQLGELVCNRMVADDVLAIFRELYDAGYQIESILPAEVWNGDDEAMMSANNTSSYNDRFVKGTTVRSKHSFGLAIDVNPLYNPCVKASGVQPAAGRKYRDRTRDMEHKITRNDLCYKLFRRYGWFWGGDWKNTKDYQHFEYHIKQ